MNILVLTYWGFNDALIQAYTLPYIRVIKKYSQGDVFLVTFESKQNAISVDDKFAITNSLSKEGIKPVFYNYHSSFIFSLFSRIINLYQLLRLIRKNNIKVVHAWCTPAAVMAVIIKKIKNSLILTIDSFEPHAEAMVENGTWKRSGLKYKVLLYMEKIEARRANNLVFAAPGMESYIEQNLGVIVNDFHVKPACVDLNAFSSQALKDRELLKQMDFEGKIVCVYAGKFGGIYLEDETFEFIKHCVQYWGKDKFCFLLLSNVSNDYLESMMRKHQIPVECVKKTFVLHSDVAKFIGLADFALCPVKPVLSKKYCSPIKNGEYWALGLPIVITKDISIDSDIISKNNAGAVIDTFDEAGYSEAIEKINSIISGKSRMDVYNKIRPLAEKYRNYSIAEDVYRSLYASV